MDLCDALTPSSALLLDFDGTLVDIAERPDAIVVPPSLIDTLQALHNMLRGAVAVISGRPIAQIDAFLAPLVLPAAGVHGTERRDAQGVLQTVPIHPLDEVQRTARALAAEHPGLLVEDKRGSVALHYRGAPDLEASCVEAMERAIARSPGLTLLRGKMVVEAKPAGATKAHAIEAFLREPPFAGRAPLFIGDDRTDEVGFASVQRAGGLGVKVGPGPTAAWQRIESSAAVLASLSACARRHSNRAAIA